MLDFVLEMVGHSTTRLLLPLLSLGRVQVQGLTCTQSGFNWLGLKPLASGKLLYSADMAAWIGILFWALVLAVVLWLL